MKKIYSLCLVVALMLGFSLTNASAQEFLENTEMCDIVVIPAFTDGGKPQYYIFDDGEEIIFEETGGSKRAQWYRIPAGKVRAVDRDVWGDLGSGDGEYDGFEADLQAYYYKNVHTGNYLGLTEAEVADLDERRGDGNGWVSVQTKAFEENPKTLGFKWIEMPASWEWGMWLSNAAGAKVDVKHFTEYFVIYGHTILSDPGEFAGVYFPAMTTGTLGNGNNAWCALKWPEVVETVKNPDYDPDWKPAEDFIDLIITDIRWEPAQPKEGDEVTFFATVKNNGNIATPAEIKHGVAFSVDGNIDGTWSDAFKGPLAAGASIELSTTMEGSSGRVWICGDKETYTILAHVNDQNDVKGDDLTNNTFEKTMETGTSGIDDVNAGKGIVYFADGVLNVIDYPSTAVVSVYTYLGQSIAPNKLAAAGIYIVKVQSGGKTFTHKVVVK